MKKNRLEIDYGFDFRLLGIVCSQKPHKMAWELNLALNIDLVRQSDHPIPFKGENGPVFTYFLHNTEVTTIRLFRNRSADEGTSKWLLAEEHPRLDYLLMVESGEEGIDNQIITGVKNIATIEWSAFLPLASLKRKENFMF